MVNLFIKIGSQFIMHLTIRINLEYQQINKYIIVKVIYFSLSLKSKATGKSKNDQALYNVPTI